jgi:uncharacterized protein (DUF4415 family)
MADTVQKQRDQEERVVTLVASLPDGTHIVQHPDGRLERRSSETDWDRLRNLTDAEIEASLAHDPDWEEFKNIDWAKAELDIPAKKQAISIRIDEDVLDYFKQEGAGYQRRMNAVLRSYMKHKRGRKKRA